MILVEPENVSKSDDEIEESKPEGSLSSDEYKETDSEGGNEDGQHESNLGWADSVAKILRTGKPKGKRTLVLSKAKKLPDVLRKQQVKKELAFQIDGDTKEEKPDPLLLLDQIKHETLEPSRKKRKELPKTRVKPNVLDRERERTLCKIATRGVVQLFNAVRDQQKDLQDKLEQAGPLERKKEQVLKSIDKRQFLNVLMGEKAHSQPVDAPLKNEAETKADSTWGVLREDFMMGAKFKDWDKQQEAQDSDQSSA